MNMPTDFAPAERAPLSEIRELAENIQKNPIIAAFHALPTPLLVINSCRQAVFCNSVFQSMAKSENAHETVGLRPGEALGCIHAHTNDGGCGTSKFCRDCGAAAAIIKSLEGTAHTEECRILVHTPDFNESLDLQVFTSPFKYEDNDLVIFTVLDISHEKRRKNLEHLFFHDVLNLATGLRYASQMLCRSSTSDYIHKQCVKMDNTISQLTEEIQAQRDVTRAEEGSLKISLKPTSSKGTLRKVWGMYSSHPLCVDRQISISEDFDDFYFNTDSTILVRTLGNMVKNALEASEPGETITIGCQKQDDYVRFWGHNILFIPEKNQRQIFKRSFSTKGDGRGLGTYSMKLLVEKYLKGKVWFESTPETGTIFSISLPDNQEQKSEQP
ncbi:HAMP domain-containing sensor histidine kinase [Desulfovibrio sp. JC022]|uniref:sensor histidine kinase n=1 Tax=Desulfovibrio sp. JC022 TaxID=2593642 RepID=UPI0013D630EB|nr:HAMP domain-containing sensor histidine kinase [Desulfovibrio sp. JC022]NDV23048.1 HAMP domain-containing histidine kinase [Desulfovibrio sp. JC022]